VTQARRTEMFVMFAHEADLNAKATAILAFELWIHDFQVITVQKVLVFGWKCWTAPMLELGEETCSRGVQENEYIS
jgi:hypothetical protein